MTGPKPTQAMRARPGGGFNQGLGQFGEHLDEAAMSQAMSNKAASQQGASTATAPTPRSTQAKQQKSPPSEMGSFTDELFVKPAQELWGSFKSLKDVDTWLGTKETTPEQEQERARKEIILKNFNKMTDEEQAITKQKYQERMKQLQEEEEEKERQKQIKQQEQAQSLQTPSTPKKGPVGPSGSKKQKATQQLQQQRQQLGSPTGSN